jgi:hypothetical protein
MTEKVLYANILEALIQSLRRFPGFENFLVKEMVTCYLKKRMATPAGRDTGRIGRAIRRYTATS